MFRYSALFWIFILFSGNLGGCQLLKENDLTQGRSSPQITPVLDDPQTLRALERELLHQVNQHRRSRQLPPLDLNPAITQQARIHSERMAAKAIEFDSSGFDDRIKTIAITLNVQKAAENIAIDPSNINVAQSTLQGWLGQISNRQNLEGDYNATGIGIAQNLAGEYYLTQIFVKEAESSSVITSPSPWKISDPFLEQKSAKNQSDPTLSSLELEINRQVNQYRYSEGLSPLNLDPRVSAIARLHSQNMAGKQATFSHDGFDQRVKAMTISLPLKSAAENLAYLKGYPDLATTAVQGWINSPGHHKNMIGKFDVTGIGVAKNAEGEYYFTQLFLLKR